MTEKLQAGDIKACYVNHRPQPGSIHVETPAATYHYTLKKPDGWETWIMNLYPCDCPAVESVVIELAGRVFRREGEDRWRMDSELPEWGVDVTFGADSVWEWKMLAAALDEIERSRS